MRPHIRLSRAVRLQNCEIFAVSRQNANKKLLLDISVRNFGVEAALG